MKCFFITTLLCVTSLNACLTKEEVEKLGYRENWRQRETNLTLYRESTNKQPEQIIIDPQHVPANRILPHNIKVYYPCPSRDFLANKSDINFETDETLVEGNYCGPEEGSERIFWSLVRDRNNTMHTVPTARLMILLTKKQLEEAGYQENWQEGTNDLRIDTINGQVIIKGHHVPVYGSFDRGTEVYFPRPIHNYMSDKNNISFETDGTHLQGHYCGPETGLRIFWSIVESEGERFTVPTRDLMVQTTLLKAIQLRRKSTI